ncbi:Asparagine synthetase glutamine-hydrolyzing [Paramagnetospirillum magnetotacticum MS-1]|uniref:asparagine synthase (glutamine-hydrolyzing) n=1 Tax=Paramagnetospirillum magnetotacticum MS-1 TaxID=272627 RepID=A0A0C2YDE6_PARME|nr:asparagine synthase (glutamine-hydrolyzing) [Paramagnetospirillum magnetotacticum]KIL97729.1 Asparagine synthetase glutamine-hydrolyzing [Paramagnetospirillum magnetotacticum MS-1]
MCGIAGFVGDGDRDILAAMAGAIAHRGPDGEGLWIDPERAVHLAHRRLAVIDLEGGAQPMWSGDGRIGVVFNGEIYNHRALRRDLESLGHVFASDHSDTEVLIHGWRQWGRDLPGRLNGMFAFAIHDRERGSLFLARDRFGEKPLYVVERPGLFAFASEISALLRHPGVPAEADALAIRKFFAYCLFPAPHTPFKAIAKLPAGHWLELSLSGLTTERGCYWRFAIEPEETGRSETELAEELRALLDASVRDRLESDVPLGIFLSGGIDSSAMLALAARHRPAASLDGFSIGFTEASFDESAFARRMAAEVGCRHHVETCDLDAARRDLPDLLARLDEPSGDPSILPTSLLCRFARRSVTVALSGDGGDELFGGYDPLTALAASRRYRALVPGAVHPAIEALAGLLPPSDANMSLDFKIQRWLRGVGREPSMWLPGWMGALSPSEIDQVFGSRLAPEELYSEAIERWEACASPDPIDRALDYFTAFYLQDGILTKSDRASMQVALEVRAPFLDNDVADFARRLPSRFKVAGGQRKVLLKKAVRGLVPDALIDRPKKGFGIPLARWLRDMDPPTAGTPLLDDAWLRQRWERHRTKRQDCRHGLWCWLALERRFSTVN